MRPINNIVDITNYVMLEYGQPMHAFDYRCIDDNAIIVRRARAGETTTTLDGQERQLDESMLLITDPKKPVGVAGVMGGLNSEITESTADDRVRICHVPRPLHPRDLPEAGAAHRGFGPL